MLLLIILYFSPCYTSKSKNDNQSPLSLFNDQTLFFFFVYQRDPQSPQTGASSHQFLALKAADSVTKQRAEKYSD